MNILSCIDISVTFWPFNQEHVTAESTTSVSAVQDRQTVRDGQTANGRRSTTQLQDATTFHNRSTTNYVAADGSLLASVADYRASYCGFLASAAAVTVEDDMSRRRRLSDG